MLLNERRSCACGCGKLAKRGRNYYVGHYPKTLIERLWMKVEKDASTGCWNWKGAKSPRGYGSFNIGNYRYAPAYRAMWTELRGPIAPGMHLDHLCRNPSCVNPDHLEPVTPKTNIYRGTAPTIQAHLFNECTQGHPQDVNAYYRKSNGRYVYCRACRREKRKAAA